MHTTARKGVKELQEQLQVEALNWHIDTKEQAERKILELRDEAKK